MKREKTRFVTRRMMNGKWVGVKWIYILLVAAATIIEQLLIWRSWKTGFILCYFCFSLDGNYPNDRNIFML